MELIVLGGDLRFAYLAAKARAQGIDVGALGLDLAPLDGIRHTSFDALHSADYIAMMNPFPKGVVAPFSSQEWSLEAVLDALSPGTTLLLFGKQGMPERVGERFDVVDVLSNEAFLIENAHLTAEGAIYAAMQRAAFSLHRTDCMVIGFGRIGAALTHMLMGLGARVSVVARRENARAHARLFGAMSMDMEQMRDALPVQRVIFTTPPETVLNQDDLSKIRSDALLIELASAPYGFSMDQALALGLNAWLEPNVPGRYCPESAGKALLNVVGAAMSHKGDGLM